MAGITRQPWLRSVILTGLVYIVIGVVAVGFAGSAASAHSRNAWRFAAWLSSVIAFAIHVAYERFRGDATAVRSARYAAGAVALGAFALAAVGPVRSHWAADNFWRTVGLSVVLWPLLTGIPAFLVAFVFGSFLGRIAGRNRPTSL